MKLNSELVKFIKQESGTESRRAQALYYSARESRDALQKRQEVKTRADFDAKVLLVGRVSRDFNLKPYWMLALTAASSPKT